MGSPDRDDAAELIALRQRLAGGGAHLFPQGVASVSDNESWFPSGNGNHADFSIDFDLGVLEELRVLYREKPRWFLLLDGEPPPNLCQSLSKAGLRRCNVYHVVSRCPTDVPMPAFEGRIVERDGKFEALLGDTCVGRADLTCAGSIGYLGGAFTEPAHRNQGAHSALIAARINAAHRQGVRKLFAETYRFLPSSLMNLERAGFVSAWNRPIYRFEQKTSLRETLLDTDQGHRPPSPA
ncbi:hypothetical protein EON81_14365 [bacterium]|nr:MAG: hypothetical protein EON81_14365 [bacterium]